MENPGAEPELEQEQLQAEAMRAALLDYDLESEDLEVLDEVTGEPITRRYEEKLPVLAIIGRPNVGKSTLVNRILGRREAVVQDTPGVTRDRVIHRANWAGRDFLLVDTGGWEKDVHGLEKQVAEQAELAVEHADAVIFVVDTTVGPTATDEQVVRLLRAEKKPVILAANKVDSSALEAEATGLWSLGLGEPIPVSALHGRGTGDLLDAAMKVLPRETAQQGREMHQQMRRVALVGRPNVGKSSLLNALLGKERSVVHDLAGTTRDPVDDIVELDGRLWEFVDTAGIKRRLHRLHGAEYYVSLRTERAIEMAEVALVLVDASVPLSEQDVRVVQQVVDAGRAIVIINNKWDLVDEERQEELKREEASDLGQVEWAPRINLSALTTWHLNRIPRAIDVALEGWETRISTGRLNGFLGKVVAAHPHPLRGGKQPRILFATQADTCPPRFVLFTTGFLDPTYRRFLERRLREEFGFEGTPIQMSVRVREKRKRR